MGNIGPWQLVLIFLLALLLYSGDSYFLLNYIGESPLSSSSWYCICCLLAID